MTSKPLRSVAADANVLLSAATGRAAKRVFSETNLIVVTTEETLAEVYEYLGLLSKKAGLDQVKTERQLAELPIEAYREPVY